jgi:hypothetical protein
MKRWMKPVSVLCVVLMAMTGLSGCDFLKEHPAETGAVAGVLAGGALGAAAGGHHHRWQSAAVGAVLGGVAGYFIGKYIETKTKQAPETNQQFGYQPMQGMRLELVGVAANPNAVTRGGSVNLQATYAIMAPDPNQQVQVTELRTIYFNGQQLTQFPPQQVLRTPGTYTTSAQMGTDNSSTPGNYEVEITVTGAGVPPKTMRAPFTVN